MAASRADSVNHQARAGGVRNTRAQTVRISNTRAQAVRFSNNQAKLDRSSDQSRSSRQTQRTMKEVEKSRLLGAMSAAAFSSTCEPSVSPMPPVQCTWLLPVDS